MELLKEEMGETTSSEIFVEVVSIVEDGVRPLDLKRGYDAFSHHEELAFAVYKLKNDDCRGELV